jgi:hypothetical protein
MLAAVGNNRCYRLCRKQLVVLGQQHSEYCLIFYVDRLDPLVLQVVVWYYVNVLV